VIELLSSPFPLRRNRALDFLSILLIGVFVVLFLLIFQPFDTNEIESPYRELFLSGYSVIIVLIFLFFRFVTPRFFVSPSVEKSWTLGKQLVWIVGQFFATSIAWYLYWAWFFDVELTFSGWGRFILVSFSVLVFPLAALIVSGYIFQLQKNKQPIPSTNRSISRGNPDGALVQQLFLSEDSSIGGFYVPTDQFLFVRAARNYMDVYYKKHGKIEQSLLRGSLKTIENQLRLPSMVHCHRSYIVNLDQVAHVSGKSQSYRLHIKNSDYLIPVSRSQEKSVLAQIASRA
jgi:hypothetical protein